MDDLLFDPEIYLVFVEAEKTKEEDLFKVNRAIEFLDFKQTHYTAWVIYLGLLN